jgi:hypothetical protein
MPWRAGNLENIVDMEKKTNYTIKGYSDHLLMLSFAEHQFEGKFYT